MCGRQIGNLLFPFVVSGVLKKGMGQPNLLDPVQVKPIAVSDATCPYCKKQVMSSYAWCPQCGTGLKPHICSYCGSLMMVGERFCLSCGAPDTSR